MASSQPFPSIHSYRTLATEHEALMQKYLHLLQIVETEKTVAKQLRQQIEDGDIEIERLKAEVTAGWGLRGMARVPAPDQCPKPQAPVGWEHMMDGVGGIWLPASELKVW